MGLKINVTLSSFLENGEYFESMSNQYEGILMFMAFNSYHMMSPYAQSRIGNFSQGIQLVRDPGHQNTRSEEFGDSEMESPNYLCAKFVAQMRKAGEMQIANLWEDYL